MRHKVRMLLRVVDGETLGPPLPDTHTHTSAPPLTVLVTPVPVRTTNHFNPLEDSFENDPWEVLPRCQAHSVIRA